MITLSSRTVLFTMTVLACLSPTVSPRVLAQSATSARFEVASIKPTDQAGPAFELDIIGPGIVATHPGGRLTAEGASLRSLIQYAYRLRPFQIIGGPAWINSAYYNVEAKTESAALPLMREMLQSLLQERFKLKVNRETRQLPVYTLTVAKSGFKLPAPKLDGCITLPPNTPPPPPPPPPPPSPGQGDTFLALPSFTPCGAISAVTSMSSARLDGGKIAMSEFVRVLTSIMGRTIVDKTQFTATFDLHLAFALDNVLAGLPAVPAPPPVVEFAAPVNPRGPTIFTAIQEQLGLRLEAGQGPVEVLVIDHAERPTEN